MPGRKRTDLSGDHYQVLEIPEGANAYEIRHAYRRLARQYHPDINEERGAVDRFNAISEAYEVLHDPDKRARYDHHHLGQGAAHAPTVNRPATATRLSDSQHGKQLAPEADLQAILELSPPEAALAAAAAITLTDARGNTIELPAGLRPGQRIRVPGAGRRVRAGEPPGDLILTVEVRSSSRSPPNWIGRLGIHKSSSKHHSW